MLKKLKLKFILHNILMHGIAVIAIFFAFCLLIYIAEEEKLTEVLEDNTQIVQSQLPSFPSTPKKPDGLIYNHSFTVLVNHDDEIVKTTQTDIEPSTVKEAVSFAIGSDMKRGNINDLHLSYIKVPVKEGLLVSFVSREHLEERVKQTFWHAALAGFVSILLFLVISKILADIAIAPVEAAWQQQKQFIADASHDLKTPLTVILANNNIISSHRDESVESQMKWIESTSEEASRMSDLINKLWELAKSEATKEELKIGEINLSETVENSILQFEVVAFEKNISIESGIQPNIIVKTHAPTFSKVLEILFDNAIKYSDEGGKISVALYTSSKKVYFSINNKGEYIKPDELPHIFERFYRTNKERNVHGHGLGLSLAKKKCDMMGAKLSVESNPDDGTTFTITLKSRK